MIDPDDFRANMQAASDLAARLAMAVGSELARENTPVHHGVMALIYLAAMANVDSQMLYQPDRVFDDGDDKLFSDMTGVIHECVRRILTKERAT